MAVRTQRRQQPAYLEETVNRRASCHPAPDAGSIGVSHPAPRCGVQCVSHPALRCGVQWRVFPGYRVVARYDVEHRIKYGMTGRVFLDTASSTGSPRTTMRGPERKGEAFICRYSWIPHQVRNDGKYRVAARYDEVTGSIGVSHPALRCGVQRGKARHSFAGISGYRVVARYDVVGIPGFRVAPGHPAQRCGAPDAGSSGVSHPAQRCGVHWRVFPGYRVVARYDVVGIPGFRIAPGHPAQRCGVQWRVFPGYRVVARYDVEHRITARYDEVTGSSV